MKTGRDPWTQSNTILRDSYDWGFPDRSSRSGCTVWFPSGFHLYPTEQAYVEPCGRSIWSRCVCVCVCVLIWFSWRAIRGNPGTVGILAVVVLNLFRCCVAHDQRTLRRSWAVHGFFSPPRRHGPQTTFHLFPRPIPS